MSYTQNLRGNTFKEIFYGTFIFQQSSMICIGRHVGGNTLALQHGGQNYFLPVSCSKFDSYARMCCKRYHIIFSTTFLKFKCKISVQKEVIHSFKNHFLVTWLASHGDALRDSSRFPAPQTSAEPKDKFLSHCSQISAGDHMQIIREPIGAVEVKLLTSKTHTYKYKLCRVWYVTKDFCSGRESRRF